MIRNLIHHLLPNDTAIVIAGIAVVLAAWGIAVWLDPPHSPQDAYAPSGFMGPPR